MAGTSPAMTEKGGAAALNGTSESNDYGATTLGVHGETTLFAGLPLIARGTLGWQHTFGRIAPKQTLAFAADPASTFSIAGAPIARDSLVAETGVDWRFAKNAVAGLYYSGSISDHTYDNTFKARLEVQF